VAFSRGGSKAAVLALVLVSAVVAGCGGAAASATAGASPTAPASATAFPSPSASAAASAAGCPALADSPVGRQLQWAVDEVNGKAATMTTADINEHFAPAALAQVSPDQLITALRQVETAGPFTLSGCEPTGADGMRAILTGPAARLSATIQVEPDPPSRIVGLLFRPVVDASPAASWADIDVAMSKIAPEASVTVAELQNDTCVPIHQYNATAPHAIGSAFKLYVLGELARQVGTGGS